MPGTAYIEGTTQIRPGIYYRVTNVGETAIVAGEAGVVAAVFSASWGPLGSPVEVRSIFDVDEKYGAATGTEIVREIFRGGAQTVLAMRAGSGGTVATRTLTDTTSGTPVQAVRVDAKYPGVRGNSLAITVRDHPSDTTLREFLVYESGTLLEAFTFVKGAPATEPAGLVAAVLGSQYVAATLLASGNNILATVTAQTLATGADPTVAAGDYTTAMGKIETEPWDWLVADTNDVIIHASIASYILRLRNAGQFVKAVISEPTSVLLNTRMTNAKAFNAPWIVYVTNGFVTTDGNLEGYRAAARVAGMIASARLGSSITHSVVANATGLVGPMTTTEIETAIRSGALNFSRDSQNRIVIEYGLTTYTGGDPNYDLGWSKIRRLRQRDAFMRQVLYAWDGMLGQVNNSADGRAMMVAVGNRVALDMVNAGTLGGAEIIEDPANPPSGDSAWFIATIDDPDSLEKVYIRFGFRLSAPEPTNTF
jgi:hypothetical protein